MIVSLDSGCGRSPRHTPGGGLRSPGDDLIFICDERYKSLDGSGVSLASAT